MATRSGGPFGARPLDGVVRSLYAAGYALVGAGVVAGVVAWVALVDAAGSLAGAAGTATHALGASTGTLAGGSLGVQLAAFALAAGCWLVGAALLVDGYLET